MANRGQKPNYSPLKKKGGGGVEQAKERGGVHSNCLYDAFKKKRESCKIHERYSRALIT